MRKKYAGKRKLDRQYVIFSLGSFRRFSDSFLYLNNMNSLDETF